MKESEFIELLNLYVDHEISVEDSARLEAEVAKSPARRKTYREYCMMHKACDVLAAHYRDPSTQTLSFMVEREPAAGWGWGAGLVTGGLLAAACLALVFVVHMHQAVQTGASVADRPMPAVAATDLPNFRRAVPAHFATVELQPVANINDWSNPGAVVPNDSFAWMNNVELAPIQRTTLNTFQVAPLLLSNGPSATQVTAPAEDTQIERAAFQFQR